MSTKCSIFCKTNLHLFTDCLAHDENKDVCLQADELSKGNFGGEGDGACYYMDREQFADMCREYLKWHEWNEK